MCVVLLPTSRQITPDVAWAMLYLRSAMVSVPAVPPCQGLPTLGSRSPNVLKWRMLRLFLEKRARSPSRSFYFAQVH